MVIAQVRTSAPKPINASDAISWIDQAFSFVSSSLPKAVAFAYFIVVCVILWRIGSAAWKRQLSSIPNMEWIAIGILFGLMR